MLGVGIWKLKLGRCNQLLFSPTRWHHSIFGFCSSVNKYTTQRQLKKDSPSRLFCETFIVFFQVCKDQVTVLQVYSTESVKSIKQQEYRIYDQKKRNTIINCKSNKQSAFLRNKLHCIPNLFCMNLLLYYWVTVELLLMSPRQISCKLQCFHILVTCRKKKKLLMIWPTSDLLL